MLYPDNEQDLEGGDADKGGQNNGSAGDQEQLVKLQQQVENLNKGVSSSRDEAKAAKAEADTLRAQIAALQSKIDTKPNGEEVELHPDDAKKLSAWARQQGLVSKDELEAERTRLQLESQKSLATAAIDEFIAKHPKYDNDDEWQKVQKEFTLYKTPTNITEYRKILNRIHKDISGDDDSEDTEAKIKAKQANNSRLKLGGGSQSSGAEAQTVEDLQKKYPSLSREQIEQRLADLKSLHAQKK